MFETKEVFQSGIPYLIVCKRSVWFFDKRVAYSKDGLRIFSTLIQNARGC